MPDFFTKSDLDHLAKFKGQKMDKGNKEMEASYAHLKSTYEKVDYWGQRVLERTFPNRGAMHIIKKPTNQANNFEHYLWVKLYPTKELKQTKILALTLVIVADQDIFFHVKIDTVGLADNDPVRQRYLEYRGDLYNSPVAKIYKAEEVLKWDWEQLISKSSEAVKSLEKEYKVLNKTLQGAANTEEEFLEVLSLYSSNLTVAYFKILERLVKILKLGRGDDRVVLSCKGKGLVFKIGQRYAFALFRKSKNPIFEVMSSKKLAKDSYKFGGSLTAYLTDFQSAVEVEGHFEEIAKGCENELTRTERSGFLGGHNDYFEKALWDLNYRNQVLKRDQRYSLKEIEILFTEYLNKVIPGSTRNYLSAFSTINKIAINEELIQESVYELQTTGEFDPILNKLQQVEQYKERNRVGNNMFSGALKHYGGFVAELSNKTEEFKLQNNMEMSLNTILYGPPGTGKTYKLNQYKEDFFTDRGIAKSSDELLKEKISSYPFWKIFAAVLNEENKYCSVAELMAHPMVKAKISDTAKTPQNTIWRILQSYADLESSQMNEKYRGPLQIFNKNAQSEWSIIESKKGEIKDIVDNELLEIAENPVLQPEQNEAIKKRYTFITFHQKYSYEDFIEGIKPLLKDSETDGVEDEEVGGQLAFELKKEIFYSSCLEALKLAGYNSFEECAKASKEEREEKFQLAKGDEQKQFALFIDEINRANISAVFGELITLIEENKRLGQEEEMWLKLPYSNEDFGVPPNLYLIGSMNTADRSIALLDIALRRRFEFVSIYPDYTLIPEWVEMLKAINDKIYSLKKNPDFFIGHAFFINQELTSKRDIFNKKIIPLLMEYFQNNIVTVKSILEVAKVEIEAPSINNNYQLIATN